MQKCEWCGYDADAAICSNECFDAIETARYIFEQEEIQQLEEVWKL